MNKGRKVFNWNYQYFLDIFALLISYAL